MTRHHFPARSIFGILLASVLLNACGPQNPAAQQNSAPGVTVITLQPRPVALIRELPGRTTAFLVAEIRPQVTGLVRDRLFTEGALVKIGQPLYQLDDRSYRANLASAEAGLARARATLNFARLSAARAAELAKANTVSRQDNESAIANLGQAEADEQAAQAAVRNSRIQLDYSRISAPIGGRIGKSSVTQGALVTANQAAALATVQQLDPIYVDLNQSSSELLRLRKEVAAGRLTRTKDIPVAILLEDGSRYAHDGRLTFEDVTVDPSTGSFLLRVVVPNPENLLLPGMYVRAAISNGERAAGLLVPQQSILRDPKGNPTVLVVGKDNKVEQRAVQVSRAVGDQWLVDGGLAAGERVIVEGLQKARPGAAVLATEAAPAGSRDGSDASAGAGRAPVAPAKS